jgi:UDP-glucose 4,6-dehydratase
VQLSRLPTLQVVVLDKLDYCASMHNLDAVKDLKNFKVRQFPRRCHAMKRSALAPRTLPGHCLEVSRRDFAFRHNAQTMFRNVQFVKGDIQSADLVNFILNEDNIDTIMHFAAQVFLRLLRLPYASMSKIWCRCLFWL